MKLLVLYQARDAAREHPGYFDGFDRLAAEGLLQQHVALPYSAVSGDHGWQALWKQAADMAGKMGADAIFLQFFQGGAVTDPSAGIRALQALPSKPLVFTSLGDGFGRFTRTVPACFRAASALSAVTFLTGMGYVARQLVKTGSTNLVLMPHGCCQVRFSSPASATMDQPDFDVVFVGSHVRYANVLSSFYWAAKDRAQFVVACEKRYGRRFGLFGNGWHGRKAWQGPVPFPAQHSAYRRSAVALGGTAHVHYDYYASDRPFIAAASGVPLVDSWIPGVDRILQPGRDWWLARDLKETLSMCDGLLEKSTAERSAIGAEARNRVLAAHTQYHRCAAMIDIVRRLREARRRGRLAAKPDLPFLCPADAAAPPAVLAWRG